MVSRLNWWDMEVLKYRSKGKFSILALVLCAGFFIGAPVIGKELWERYVDLDAESLPKFFFWTFSLIHLFSSLIWAAYFSLFYCGKFPFLSKLKL